MSDAFAQQASLESPTGARLNLYSQPAAGSERAAIQINHGLAEHAARYARFARFLAERGFHVYAHDHRGHGHTTAPDAPLGSFASADGAELVLADVGAVRAHIAQRHPGLPLFVFGHSMGGQIALNHVLRHPEGVHAAAVWNASFSAGLLGRIARGLLAWERFRLGSDTPSRILPKLTFRAWANGIENRRTMFDWLSRDPAEVDKYVADPLCGWDASVGMWSDVLDFVFFGADDASFPDAARPVPFNLVGGGKDPATEGGRAVTELAGRMRRMGFADVTDRVYEDTRHESLNEINRDAVMEDFAAWAERTLSEA